MKVAINQPGIFSRSKQSRSNVQAEYAALVDYSRASPLRSF